MWCNLKHLFLQTGTNGRLASGMLKDPFAVCHNRTKSPGGPKTPT